MNNARDLSSDDCNISHDRLGFVIPWSLVESFSEVVTGGACVWMSLSQALFMSLDGCSMQSLSLFEFSVITQMPVSCDCAASVDVAFA